MASLFPQLQPEDEAAADQPPDDLLQRARQTAQQELEALGRKPQQQSKSTLLTGHRRFE